jgi:stearoyl-CoA desaturase (Delta-9 desaturase)
MPATPAATVPLPMSREPDERVNWPASIPFLVFHLTPLLLVWTGVSAKAVVLGLVTYWGRMFFITAGYHRYFSHKTYKLSRVPQFLMALGGTTSLQKGPLWWAANHRDHHRFSDTEQDVHSPQKGFWWSHVGWILCDKFKATDESRIKDFATYPELRWLNRHDALPAVGLALVCLAIGGWSGLVVGFFVSTIVLWHSTFFVNSLAHVMGRRRYATEDTSRNSVIIAVLTMGEGWHNNHHYAPSSCRNGFFWWEWDPTYYVLKGLSRVGVVKDIKAPPARVLAANRLRDGSLDIGMFRANWTKAARAISAAGVRRGEQVHAIQEDLRSHKEALEALLDTSLDSATELATTIRRGQREVLREA